MSRPRILVAVTVFALAACSGGAGDEDASTTTTEEPTTTTSSGTEEIADAQGGFRAGGTLDVVGFETSVTAVVADAETYTILLESPDSHDEEVRIGPRLWLRSAPDAAAAAARPFQELDADIATAVASLTDEASFGPGGFEDVPATDVAGQALVEVLLTDPQQLVDLDALDGTEEGLQSELPPEIAEALDDLEVDAPTVELDVSVRDGRLLEATMEVSSPGSVLELDVVYSDHGEVRADDIEAPDPSEIDPTPWADEEALREFADTPLVALTTPPDGLVLVGAFILDPIDTFEGCTQVELDYDVPPGEVVGDRFLTLFLLPKVCASGADGTPFDETTAGFPSRFDGSELLVGDTVVQVLPGELSPTSLDNALTSLAPVDVQTLIASVVPTE